MRRALLILSAFFVIGIFLGCTPTAGPDKTIAGAVLGTAWGAGAGAVIGNQVNDTGPGALLGMAIGGGSGMIEGMGLDIAEGTEIDQQRRLDALKVQVGANERGLAMLQNNLDNREMALNISPVESEVYFDKGMATLNYGSAVKVQRLANAIKQNPYVGMIQVHGHSDDTGNAEENVKLSEARARNVSAVLVSNGVSNSMIRLFPHGIEAPQTSNETDAGKQLNRRVEIIATK